MKKRFYISLVIILTIAGICTADLLIYFRDFAFTNGTAISVGLREDVRDSGLIYDAPMLDYVFMDRIGYTNVAGEIWCVANFRDSQFDPAIFTASRIQYLLDTYTNDNVKIVHTNEPLDVLQAEGLTRDQAQ